MKNLSITFGIITTEHTSTYLRTVIDSIHNQKISNESYEILIVGNCDVKESENIKVIPFDETQRRMWITKKKNMITNHAKFDIIVYMHDYFILSDDWYTNFLQFGLDWDICMNRIINKSGDRLIDWMGMPDDRVYGNVILPYEYEGSDGMYVPGYFWIAKKSVMIQFPLDEEFEWGDGEDIEWSKRVLGGFPPIWLKNIQKYRNGMVNIKRHKYVMNKECVIKSLKQKNFPPDLFKEYDLHSGNGSRPLLSSVENYEYLKYRK
jgi:hypothetical protein